MSSPNANGWTAVGLPDDFGAAGPLPELRDPVSVGVRRVGTAGAKTRAVFAGVAGAGVLRGDKAGADAAKDPPAGDGVGRAGAGGPPAFDSTRRAWCSRSSRPAVLPLVCCTT
ncbi:MAG: hypothetical protein ORN20_00970 [Candidatus Nanopelagicales bacterium]|nr:hypothetical protein [Candidatus Nanopelagicales bacterium]